jgi:hypothetical protein
LREALRRTTIALAKVVRPATGGLQTSPLILDEAYSLQEPTSQAGKTLLRLIVVRTPRLAIKTYRFLWLRSFHHPVSVRVVCIDNACELTGLRTDGQGGYAPGSVVERKTRRLSDAEIVSFREMLARAEFWRPQPVDDRIGDDRIVLDGAQWILEGRRGQTYHLRDVWSPEKSGPYAVFRELCLHLVRLSGLAVRQDDIY